LTRVGTEEDAAGEDGGKKKTAKKSSVPTAQRIKKRNEETIPTGHLTENNALGLKGEGATRAGSACGRARKKGQNEVKIRKPEDLSRLRKKGLRAQKEKLREMGKRGGRNGTKVRAGPSKLRDEAKKRRRKRLHLGGTAAFAVRKSKQNVLPQKRVKSKGV